MFTLSCTPFIYNFDRLPLEPGRQQPPGLGGAPARKTQFRNRGNYEMSYFSLGRLINCLVVVLEITITTTTILTKSTTCVSTKATLTETTPFRMGTPRHQLKTKPGIREVWWWVCVWVFVHIRCMYVHYTFYKYYTYYACTGVGGRLPWWKKTRNSEVNTVWSACLSVSMSEWLNVWLYILDSLQFNNSNNK